jgi:predicted DNA-binding transcriptional regulator AlpA
MNQAPQLLTVDEVMARVGGYANRDAFVRAARKSGLPRIRINRRVIRFEPAAVDAWLRRKAA